MARRVIALLGQPIVTEDGAATEAITPGHLLAGVTSITKHASAGAAAARNFALEQDYFGKDIDEAYAIGDRVRVGQFAQGDHVYALLASGANVVAGALLESAGDGTLETASSGVVLARALEAVNPTALTHVRVEIL